MLSKYLLYYGTDSPPSRPILLRAGKLTMQFDAGALRYIRYGEIEILRQIYAAVRDQNWGTVPGVLYDLDITQLADAFTIRFRSEHRAGDIAFTWNGTIIATPDNTLTFTFVGEALSSFKRNRIGFCVLHPITCAGERLRIEHGDGHITEGRFPQQIAPYQPFMDIRALHHEAAPDIWIDVRMMGDTFEMEDQRNWIDASYKTYCTPLGLPFPAQIEAGQRIEQSVALRISPTTVGADTSFPAYMAVPLTITLHPEELRPLPAIGLCTTDAVAPLSATEAERLRRLHLAHLRVDLRLNSADWRDRLSHAIAQAHLLNTQLELALHLSDNAETELSELRTKIDALASPIARYLVFHQLEKSTTARWVQMARRILGTTLPIGGGTDAFFTELNRERPPAEILDMVSYSTNPQVHAFDNASLVETLAVLPVTIESCRAFSAGKPISISPLTFKMRWNPNATASDDGSAVQTLPANVDLRQMSLFGAGWTLGSLKWLTTSTLASVTFYQTVGWLGIMEQVEGAPLPEQFPSIAGGVYPMYHVFADVGELASAKVLQTVSSDALRVECLALREDDHLRLLLVNFTPDSQTVTINGINGKFDLKLLDETNGEFAMRAPEAFRSQAGMSFSTADGSLQITLLPYALARLDQTR